MPTFREDLHLGHKVPTVETDDIILHAITEEKMADNSVSTRTIQDKAVTEPKLDDNSVSERTIKSEAVTESKLGDGSVSNRTIKDDAVQTQNIQNGSVTEPKMANDAISTRTIINKAVTPAKRSDDFDAQVVLPYVNPVDTKYQNITNELYSMIESLQVGGVALSQKFGYREDIGISQKTLTKAIGRIWDELGIITGRTYMDFTLTVEPTFMVKEGSGTVTVTADCSEAISDFDSIKLYLNEELMAESHDVSRYIQTLIIENDGENVIEATGIIMGKTITKQVTVNKAFPFFMGGGHVYTDILSPTYAKTLVGTLEGDYDVTIPHNGDYLFIVISVSHKDEFRRADMNGLGLKVEIPLEATVTPDYVVYKSLNTYQADTYNIDIDINS